MVDSLMADSSSEYYLQAGASSLKYISSSLLGIPGFLVSFRIKTPLESESLRSPTTPLDFRFCSNLSKPFGDFCGEEVGLAIINSEVLDSPSKKNVLFGPQVKTKIAHARNDRRKSIDSSMKSSSFPNYAISSLSIPEFPNLFHSSKSLFRYEKDKDTSCSSTDFGACSLPVKSNSDPIDIDLNRVGSLSAREIELSEDYTCIISHGPNPKTTHIFGDCILECHTNELQVFGDNSSDNNLPVHFSYETNLEEEEDILIYSSSFNEDLCALGASYPL